VVATSPGAAPEAVSAQVTAPIEDGLEGMSGLRDISSESVEGLSSISLRFEFGTDVDEAVREMEETVARLQDQLPPSVTPVVEAAGSTDEMPAVMLAASGCRARWCRNWRRSTVSGRSP